MQSDITPSKPKRTLKDLFADWDGEPPEKLPEWEQLPPVGRETI